MSSEEIRLQESLQAIENGVPLEVVFARLEDGSEETVDLIHIVQAIRTIAHPEPSLTTIQATRRKVLSGLKRQPFWRPGYKAPYWSLQQLFAPILRVGLVVGILVGLFILGARFYQAGPSSARAAVIMEINGLVEVGPPGDPSAWTGARNGGKLTASQSLHTGSSSSATLLFSDGSQALVGPQSNLNLSRLRGGWNGSLSARIELQQGSLENNTFTSLRSGSAYEIQTPSGEVASIGTHFTVTVSPDGTTRVFVSKGEVRVKDNLSQMILNPGQAVVTKLGEKTQPPAYEFNLQGALGSTTGSSWDVNGMPFILDANTWLDGTFQTGLIVKVQGRILADKTWVADFITIAQDQGPSAFFFGVVDNMGEHSWVISGQVIQVDANTRISPNIAQNVAVKVNFILQEDGSTLATRIVKVQQEDSPASRPQLGFDPSGQEEKSCTKFTQVLAVVTNRATQPGDEAEAIDLNYAIESGAEYLQSISLSPQTIDSLGPGESIPVIITLMHTSAWDTAKRGSKIRLRFFVVDTVDESGSEPAHLNLVINRNCSGLQDAKEAPGQNKTQEAPNSNPPGQSPCEDPNNPVAMSLAEQYGVPVSEINGWLCQGLNKHEIDLGYNLAQTYNVDPATIFQLRSQGLSWSEIKQQISGSGNSNQDSPGNSGNTNPVNNNPTDNSGNENTTNDNNSDKTNSGNNTKEP